MAEITDRPAYLDRPRRWKRGRSDLRLAADAGGEGRPDGRRGGVHAGGRRAAGRAADPHRPTGRPACAPTRASRRRCSRSASRWPRPGTPSSPARSPPPSGARRWRWTTRVMLAPTINIVRTPLWGRNFETYSEDPFLAGRLGAAYVEGLQGEGVGASLKHYAANNQEENRMTVSVEIDERTLREIYLAAFEHVVKAANPWTVMASYNKVDGVYATENRRLLIDILKDEWGYDGVVVSDWGAVHATAAAANGGTDLEMPGPAQLVRRQAAGGGEGRRGPAGADRRRGAADVPADPAHRRARRRPSRRTGELRTAAPSPDRRAGGRRGGGAAEERGRPAAAGRRPAEAAGGGRAERRRAAHPGRRLLAGAHRPARLAALGDHRAAGRPRRGAARRRRRQRAGPAGRPSGHVQPRRGARPGRAALRVFRRPPT